MAEQLRAKRAMTRSDSVQITWSRFLVQVKLWLERVEQDGWIRKISKKHLKFALRGSQLELESNA